MPGRWVERGLAPVLAPVGCPADLLQELPQPKRLNLDSFGSQFPRQPRMTVFRMRAQYLPDLASELAVDGVVAGHRVAILALDLSLACLRRGVAAEL